MARMAEERASIEDSVGYESRAGMRQIIWNITSHDTRTSQVGGKWVGISFSLSASCVEVSPCPMCVCLVSLMLLNDLIVCY
jgi:hypothetical protein